MQALDDVVRDGKARFVGLSNFKRDEIEACGQSRRVDVVQYGWNLFDRRMEREILPHCAEQGIGFMAYGSLAYRAADRHVHRGHGLRRARTGAPAKETWARSSSSTRSSAPSRFADNVRAVEELKELAASYGKSLPQLALRWAISNPISQHRAGRVPHDRRGRGQRRRHRLVDQRR